MSALAGILDAWPVLLGMLLAVAGAIVSTRGNRRAQDGAALARAAAAIESQLTRPPAEVIAEASRGLDMARSGRRLALVGLSLSCLGCGLAVGSLLVQLAT